MVAVVLFGFGIYYYVGSKKLASSNTTTAPYYPKVDSRTGSSSSTGDVNNSSSSTTTGDTKIEKDGITISTPNPGAQIEPGTTVVNGTVTSSVGGDLYYMVKGATTGVLVDNKVQTIAPGSEGVAYSFTVSFDNLPKGSDSAVLEVYLMSGTTKLGYADVGVKI